MKTLLASEPSEKILLLQMGSIYILKKEDIHILTWNKMKLYMEESIFILQGRFTFRYLFFLKRIFSLPLDTCRDLITKITGMSELWADG